MKCFYHPAQDAIALCKSCHRALCRECAADVPPGTACRDRCEPEVQALNIILERSKSAYQKTGKAYRRIGWSILCFGLIFLVLGVLPIMSGGDTRAFPLIPIGIVFTALGLFSFRSARQIEAVEAGK